jgi:hypothetical protein
MSPSSDEREKLERLMHRTLRDLPPRRAPDSLEQRVRAEIERRAARPWWRKAFVHWPVAALAGFVALCTGIVIFAFMGGVRIMGGFDAAPFQESLAQPFSWMESGLAIVRAMTRFVEIILRNIPPLFLYGGLVFFAAMYAVLFGLGAAAYKALHGPR